jgi:hypothetical protein
MQLDARPRAQATVSADAAKAKLAGLRELLGQRRGDDRGVNRH